MHLVCGSCVAEANKTWTSVVGDVSAQVLELARKQRMNTDVRSVAVPCCTPLFRRSSPKTLILSFLYYHVGCVGVQTKELVILLWTEFICQLNINHVSFTIFWLHPWPVCEQDFVDAFEKLLRLGLKQKQEREIIHVILDMALQEKAWNPFYAYLTQKFCEYDKRFRVSEK